VRRIAQFKELIMNTHKYRVGQTLRFQHSAVTGGGFDEVKVERLLPAADHAENQYQVQSLPNGPRRVVRESEIGR
jgi:hypothetical protein